MYSSKVNEEDQIISVELNRAELCLLFQALELRRCTQMAGVSRYKDLLDHKPIKDTVRLTKKITSQIRTLDRDRIK